MCMNNICRAADEIPPLESSFKSRVYAMACDSFGVEHADTAS